MSKNHLRDRKDIPVELTWDLSKIYSSTADWERDFQELDQLQEAFNAFRTRLGENAATLRDAIKALDALERKLEKLYTYSHLLHDGDTGDAEGKTLQSRAGARASRISADCAWFEPELLAIDDEKMRDMILDFLVPFYVFLQVLLQKF